MNPNEILDKFKTINVRTATDEELMAIAAKLADDRGTVKMPSRDDVISILIKKYKESPTNE